MNKQTFKKIFSRFSFVGLTIVLLFAFSCAVLFGVFWLVQNILLYYFPQLKTLIAVLVFVADWIITVITVLHAANRDMVPETKIPWIICILALNVLGVLLYAFFSHHILSRRQRRILIRMYEQSRELAGPTLEKEEIERELGRWADNSAALTAASPAAVLFGGTKTEYFPSGEEFAERYLEDLERAEKYIFVEYFIIAKGKFWSRMLEVLTRKAQSGVEVRVMYDDIGSMGRVHVNYHRTLRKLGIKAEKFNPFLPVISEVHNNRDHRKITVIDGRIAYTGGINLADEYMNITHPHGYFKDTAVRLEGEGVRSFILMFLQLFNVRKKVTEDFSAYLPESYERFEGEGFVQPYGDGPRPFYRRQLGEDVYINVLNNAKKYVYISTPYLIIDYRMREAMVLAAQRGVDVRILMPANPDKKLVFAVSRSNYLALIRGGVKIYSLTGAFVHSKCFVADDEVAIVGTINLDYRSFLFHFEDAVLMFRTRAVGQVKEDLEKCYEKSVQVSEREAKRNIVWRGLTEVAKLFAPLF